MNVVKLNTRVVPRPPTFKNLAEIRNSDKVQKGTGQGTGGTFAFVVPHFRFVHDHLKDWKVVSSPPNYRQFVGTSLTLEVSPEMFLPLDYQKYPKVMLPVKKHEQEHVTDLVSIVTRLLPAALAKNDTFKEYFLDRKPIPEGTYRYMLPNRVADIVTKVFLELWDEAVARRDTPARYKVVQEQVEKGLQSF